jgi:hypothetical protein
MFNQLFSFDRNFIIELITNYISIKDTKKKDEILFKLMQTLRLNEEQKAMVH